MRPDIPVDAQNAAAGATSSAWPAPPTNEINEGVRTLQLEEAQENRPRNNTRLGAGLSTAQNNGALTEDLENVNRPQLQQGDHPEAVQQVDNAAVPQRRERQAAPVADATQAHIAPAPGSAEEVAFWAKLEDIQNKYQQDFLRLLPVIQRIRDPQSQPRRELFMKHIKDCSDILRLTRSSPIPRRLTMDVLVKAEKFISQVVAVYSRYAVVIGVDNSN